MTDTAGTFTAGAAGLFTVIVLTSETPGGVIVNVFTLASGALIAIVNDGGVIFKVICGASRFIVISIGSTFEGAPGSSIFATSIATGFNVGSNIVGAAIGVVTPKLIAGLTTSLGISICGVIVISSFKTDFGRTFAIIWISTSGSCTCSNEANP